MAASCTSLGGVCEGSAEVDVGWEPVCHSSYGVDGCPCDGGLLWFLFSLGEQWNGNTHLQSWCRNLQRGTDRDHRGHDHWCRALLHDRRHDAEDLFSSVQPATTVFKSEFLQAIAVVNGMAPSAVASAGYTINLNATPTPTFNLVGGSYAAAQSVTISDTAKGANIYYTLYGSSVPSANSMLYTGPIAISKSTTLNAIATATGLAIAALAREADLRPLPGSLSAHTRAASIVASRTRAGHKRR
jgi:hypothetical protein